MGEVNNPLLALQIARLTPEQKTVYDVLQAILDLFYQYQVATPEEIQYLLSEKSAGYDRERLWQIIARRLDRAVELSEGDLVPSQFDPWHTNFQNKCIIEPYIDDDPFFQASPGFLRAMRGLLTAILRRYRDLRQSKTAPKKSTHKGANNHQPQMA